MKNADQPINPVVNSDGYCTSFDNLQGTEAGAIGLTKREYFAAMAMQGLLSNPNWMRDFGCEKYLMESDVVAKVAVIKADAVLSELKNPNQ